MGDSAVAMRYAEALYELASEQNRTDAVLSDLAELKQSFQSNAAGWTRLMHPRTAPAEKDQLLKEQFLGGRDPLVANLARLLVSRRRENVLQDFFRCYLDVHDERSGNLRVLVESATELSAAAQEDLRGRLASATGKTVTLECRVLPELLGGLRLLIGSRLVDGSLKRRLEQIERGLKQAPLNSN